MYTNRLGVAIISFDRPLYLARLLTSLEQNTFLEDTDFHFFQDGAVNKFSARKAGHPERICQAIHLATSAKLPNKHFHVRSDNVSIGIHQFEAYEWMAARYDAVLVLEDDIVVSPYYLRVMRGLFDAISDMHDVFSASSNFIKEVPGDIGPYLDKMVCVERHWWGELFASSQWARIRPYFLQYYELIRDIDYQTRPHERIVELFGRHGFRSDATTQDAGRDMAVHGAGLKRIRLAINRAIYIGKRGLHCTPALYHRQGWGRQEPYIFPEDETIERFELLPKEPLTCGSAIPSLPRSPKRMLSDWPTPLSGASPLVRTTSMGEGSSHVQAASSTTPVPGS